MQTETLHDVQRLLGDAANFELAHAMRLYCRAHEVHGPLSSFLLTCSDAAMGRVDSIIARVSELSGRPHLPHISLAPAADVAAIGDAEVKQARVAIERYTRLQQQVPHGDFKTHALLGRLRDDHLREGALLARLLQAPKLD